MGTAELFLDTLVRVKIWNFCTMMFMYVYVTASHYQCKNTLLMEQQILF